MHRFQCGIATQDLDHPVRVAMLLVQGCGAAHREGIDRLAASEQQRESSRREARLRRPILPLPQLCANVVDVEVQREGPGRGRRTRAK